MRKLLVASQKGGVGKTTSSINLAAATAMAGSRVLLLDADPLSSISASLNLGQNPQRQLLRQIGIDLPGVLVSNVIPGLDVLSPYDDGGCSDEDLDHILALLATSTFQDGYNCLLVDTPPFLGANPGQLLATSDEFILVMRAEPMAYRTLPAFLELVQRANGGPNGIKMKGILLTLPDGEQPGGRWERELRGRFGSRIMSQVIPFDESIGEAMLFGQIVCHAHQSSPVALAYHQLIEQMQFEPASRDLFERTSVATVLMQSYQATKSTPPRRTVPVQAKKPTAPSRLIEQNQTNPMHHPPAPTPSRNGTQPVENRPSKQGPRPSIPEPIARRHTPAVPIPTLNLPEEPRGPIPLAPASTEKAPQTPPPVGAQISKWQVVFWFTLAIVMGIGLRFTKVPNEFIPYLVGLAVAAVTILVMKYWLITDEPKTPEKAPVAQAKEPQRNGSSLNHRLSGLKRRLQPQRSRNVSEN